MEKYDSVLAPHLEKIVALVMIFETLFNYFNKHWAEIHVLVVGTRVNNPQKICKMFRPQVLTIKLYLIGNCIKEVLGGGASL